MSRPYSSEKNHFDLVQIFSIPISSLFYLRHVNTVFSLSLQAYGIFSEFGVIKLGKACFLVATERLHKSACPSVRPLFQQSVTLLVTLSLFGLLGATNAVYSIRPCFHSPPGFRITFENL